MPSSQKAQLDAASKRADKLRAKGKTVDFDELLKMEPDSGTTNIRNTTSKCSEPTKLDRFWLESSASIPQAGRSAT
jgi:hypothetical protein